MTLGVGMTTNNNTNNLRLTRTARGWKAFDMIIMSSLGANLRTTLKAAVQAQTFKAVDDKHGALFEHIRDILINVLRNEQDLISELAEQCNPSNGVEMYFYLRADNIRNGCSMDRNGPDGERNVRSMVNAMFAR